MFDSLSFRSARWLIVLGALPLVALAQSGRSTPVNVQNFPEVQGVEDVHHPAFQPAQFTNSRFTEISGGGITLLSTGVDAADDPVPAGKRLVVQHLSYQLRSEGLVGEPLCAARVLDGFDTVVQHPLPMVISTFRDSRVATASLPITIYVDAGQAVSVSCSVRVTDDVVQVLGLTGYFIDL